MNKHQQYRRANGNFRSLGDDKYGGFKTGVQNGPEPRTDRGLRRKAKRNTK